VPLEGRAALADAAIDPGAPVFGDGFAAAAALLDAPVVPTRLDEPLHDTEELSHPCHGPKPFSRSGAGQGSLDAAAA
jgi:hypothetical protein